MHIRLTMPPAYKNIETIKRENYPFRRMYAAFVGAVNELSEKTNMSGFATIGLIETQLLSGVPHPIYEDEEGVKPSIDMSISDNEMEAFYDKVPTSNKQTTLMLVRLMLRLQTEYGSSIPAMIYRIQTIEVIESESSAAEVYDERLVEQSEPHVTAAAGFRIAKRERDAEPDTSSEKTDVSKKAKTKQKPKAATKAQVKPKAKSKSTSTSVDEDTTGSHTAADALLEKAKALKGMTDLTSDSSDSAVQPSKEKATAPAKATDAEEGIKEGDVVETNPLLDSFYDF